MKHQSFFILTIIFLLQGNISLCQIQSFKELDWKTDSTGLKYYIYKSGNAIQPNSHSQVEISFVTILDGDTKADTSLFSKLTKVENIELSRMTLGFVYSVCKLGEGGEGFFCVPPNLAYGNLKGNEFQNQTFFFYIKLLKIIKSEIGQENRLCKINDVKDVENSEMNISEFKSIDTIVSRKTYNIFFQCSSGMTIFGNVDKNGIKNGDWLFDDHSQVIPCIQGSFKNNKMDGYWSHGRSTTKYKNGKNKGTSKIPF